MNIVAFILAVVAAVVFLLSEKVVATRWPGRSTLGLGLALLTIALIVQFCATSHQITF